MAVTQVEEPAAAPEPTATAAAGSGAITGKINYSNGDSDTAISMDADPGSSVRTMKDSSLVRSAEAVRDGLACAMVSAGNTGATMASALLRMGRIRGVARPAIAAPLPELGRPAKLSFV